MICTNANFRTSDTPLAAYLFSQGFKLLDVDYSDPRAVFIFDNDSKALAEHVRAYEISKAEGNIVAFFRAYRALLRRLRNKM